MYPSSMKIHIKHNDITYTPASRRTGHVERRISYDTAKAQIGGMRPNAIMADPNMAGRDNVTLPLAVALTFMKISGAEDPKARSVAPAMSWGTEHSEQIMSIAGQRYESQTIASPRKTKKVAQLTRKILPALEWRRDCQTGKVGLEVGLEEGLRFVGLKVLKVLESFLFSRSYGWFRLGDGRFVGMSSSSAPVTCFNERCAWTDWS